MELPFFSLEVKIWILITLVFIFENLSNLYIHFDMEIDFKSIMGPSFNFFSLSTITERIEIHFWV